MLLCQKFGSVLYQNRQSPQELTSANPPPLSMQVLMFKEHFPLSHLKWLVKSPAVMKIPAPFLVLGLLCTERFWVFDPEQRDPTLKMELALSKASGPDDSEGSLQPKLLYELFFPVF